MTGPATGPGTGPGTGTIKRVVLPLDAASESRAAIDTAVRLAARAKAPLHAIFVEDENLLSLASMPFARQFTLGAAAETLTTGQIELHLKAAAGRVRRELFALAERHGVECTFEVVRGDSGSALSAASEHDLVVAGGRSRPIGRHFRLECRWWSALDAAPGAFLMVHDAWSPAGSVVALLRDRSAASRRLMAAAAQVAEATGGTLTVICPPEVAGRDGFEKWLAEQLAGTAVRLQVEVAPTEPAQLRARIAELGCCTLAIESGGAEGGGERLREFVAHFACDILIVR